MSKGKVLIIHDCYECHKNIFVPESNTYFEHQECAETGWTCPDEGIPDWCPLPDLPERKGEMDYLAAGYNKCLDDILEETQE